MYYDRRPAAPTNQVRREGKIGVVAEVGALVPFKPHACWQTHASKTFGVAEYRPIYNAIKR